MKPFKERLKGIRQRLKVETPSTNVAVSFQPKPEPEIDFKQLFSDVKPLKATPRCQTPLPRPLARQKNRIQHFDLTETNRSDILRELINCFDEQVELHEYCRTGVQRTQLKKLRQGQIKPVYSLDLHGYDRHDAKSKLVTFLHYARQRSSCVRIIHGQGFGSNGEPVLKNQVRMWLKTHPHVLAFCEAPLNHGGAGALLVLLKREKTNLEADLF